MSAPVLSWLLIVKRQPEGTSSNPIGFSRVLASPPEGRPAKSPEILIFKEEPQTPTPKSQSFSRSYRPNFPTSLTYIITSTRGFSPRRPDAVMSTANLWCIMIHRFFMDHRQRTGQLRRSTAMPPMDVLLGTNPFKTHAH